jgi:predicted lipoprotein with Yx(FWY)xxD motif
VSESRISRGLRLLAISGASALIVAACSSAATPSPSPAVATSAGASPTASGVAGTTTTVNVANNATVGNFLTGADGKTLYVKKDDSTAAPNCTGACVTNWPPLLVQSGEQVVAGAGVTGSLTTFTRPEGTQVAYNGAPLYYFKGDAAAGDTKGQGVGGVWSVAAP